MAKDGRPPEFLFEPLRFLNDQHVRTMRPHELGAYAALFCNGWGQPEPGVLPDDDRLLSLLARMTPDEWAEVRDRVALCYDRTERPGFWVQQGTVRTAAEQAEKLAAARASGAKGARARWETPPETPTPATEGTTLGLPLGTPLGSGGGEPNGIPVAVGRGRGGVGVGEEEAEPTPRSRALATWRQRFVDFWAAWPKGHKIDREKCERLWERLAPRDLEEHGPLLQAIMAGLERWKRSAEWAKADPQTGEVGAFIPHPATWLRNKRWEAECREVTQGDGIDWARKLEKSREEGST